MQEETRTKLEAEIIRGLDRLKQLSPESDDYQKISAKVIQFTELANREDDNLNKYDVEKERIAVEKERLAVDKDKLELSDNIEKSRLGADSEKLRLETEKLKLETELEDKKLTLETALENKKNKRDTIRAYILAGFSGLVTLGTFVGTWIFNARSQVTSEYFEENGHAHTSRFNRFQLKEPNHPTVKM